MAKLSRDQQYQMFAGGKRTAGKGKPTAAAKRRGKYKRVSSSKQAPF